jgi:phospholipid/cholesterol/gamma-HCH transport system substrate-binding protein
LRETGSGAAGHSQDLQDVLRAAPSELPDLGTVSEALASPKAALPALLASARQFSSRFTGREQRISQLITQFDTSVRAVAVDNGTALGSTLQALPNTFDHANYAFHALKAPLDDTEAALTDLGDGAHSLGVATPDARGVLAESRAPLDKVPHVSDHAIPAVKDLTGTASDLRPLASHLAEGLDHARAPLQVLSPYAADITDFFSSISSSLSQGDGDKHWLRLLVLPSTDEVTGTALIKDPLLERDPYPAPGTERSIRKKTILGGTR